MYCKSIEVIIIYLNYYVINIVVKIIERFFTLPNNYIYRFWEIGSRDNRKLLSSIEGRVPEISLTYYVHVLFENFLNGG